MDVTLELIKKEDKYLLVKLMELCNYEFSVYENRSINDIRYYGCEQIDDYWEDGRASYLIRIDGEVAGYVLISQECKYIHEENAHCVGEFFIMLKYRRMGVGINVATQLFDRHPGFWEVCYLRSYTSAGKFWKSVIEKYTDNHYETCGTEKDKLIGYIFQK